LEKAEKARIANQVEKLGPEGLKEVERKLEAAKADNAKLIPTDVLTSFPVPDVKSISWIPVQSVQEPGEGRKANPHFSSMNGELQRHIESDGQALPFFVEYDHVEACTLSLYSILIVYAFSFSQKSDFVSIHGFFSLDKLPNHLRPYMPAYLGAFFALPVVRHNGVRLTHEDVVDQLDDCTVSYKAKLGVSGDFTNTLRVAIAVEKSEYETAIAWMRDLIYGSEFNQERCVFLLIEGAV
jgi:Zn-dependent M16 (insulinase) family peptidase